MTAGAALLRFWGVTGLGLTHFDEGSFALAGKWVASLGAEGNPIEPVHSPPLYPLLIGLAFWLGPVRDWVAIAVSAVAGAATVIPVYGLGRRWFNRRTGVMAAAFWLTCAYGWFYSRMALTDAWFCLLFWAALYGVDVALERGGVRRCATAGAVAGLCWQTKYHGFFALLVPALWLAVETVSRPAARAAVDLPEPVARWRRLGGITAAAAGIFLPWVLVLAFAGKLPEVVSSLWGHSAGAPSGTRLSFSAMIVYLVQWTSPILVTGATASLLAALLASSERHRRLVIVTLFWVVAPMTYRSFPRLLLPLVPALCLLAAGGISWLGDRLSASAQRIWVPAAFALVIGWNLAVLTPYLGLRTDAYRRAAAFVEALGRPTLSQCSKNYYFYEQRKSQELRLRSVAELDQALEWFPEPVIVFDPLLNRFPAKRAWLTARRKRMRLLRRFPIEFYPPNLYQGFNLGDPDIAHAQAPSSLTEPVIEVWRAP